MALRTLWSKKGCTPTRNTGRLLKMTSDTKPIEIPRKRVGMREKVALLQSRQVKGRWCGEGRENEEFILIYYDSSSRKVAFEPLSCLFRVLHLLSSMH